MPTILLNTEQVKRVKVLAKKIADHLDNLIEKYSSISVERAVLRLYGVDGTDSNGIPLPNVLADILKKKNKLNVGASRNFAAAMLESGQNAMTTAKLIEQGKISFGGLSNFKDNEIDKKERALSKTALSKLDSARKRKKDIKNKTPLPMQPFKYTIVATGDIYEDCAQACSAVLAGADIIAVIRSTAQSLLDYVPYGPTRTGVGGTFATQENFKIIRKTLNKISKKEGRYIRLVNYASGLCMAEIAVCAAFEDLDVLLNDSMYGILFRDINMKRTFIDQYFSRLICARAQIMINTGEDNYLTTSDAIEKACTVTASQLINEALAKKALLTNDLIGLGHAFEIDPEIENSFLYELAHAQLSRQLFPDAPVKYMPPTKYKSPDIFFSHCMDTMFNLASITTKQSIHLGGVLTEAIHTPFMQDRFQSISSINYVFNSAKNLGDEIEFKKDGIIANRAKKVLSETEILLTKISKNGLMESISRGVFADISRKIDGGKGFEGVFKKDKNYSNPVMTQLEYDGIIYE